jgi:hypothetical protein
MGSVDKTAADLTAAVDLESVSLEGTRNIEGASSLYRAATKPVTLC